MLNKLSICFLLFLICTTPLFAEETKKPFSRLGMQIANFELKDAKGELHKLVDLKERKGVAVLFLGTECPLAKLYGPRFQELAKKYEARGIAFWGVCSNQQDSLSELNAFAKEFDLQFPLLKDVGNKIADAFHAERTPEVFLLNADRKVIYHGRVDDQFTYGIQRPKIEHDYLTEALEALLADKPIAIAETEVVGCHIGRLLEPDEQSEITFSKQISRIFQARCVECHREGDIGPFPLVTYEDAVGWAEMIREVVEQKKMPPWHAESKPGQFANDAHLTLDEKQLIYAWVDAGAPKGDPKDMPPLREFDNEWRIGKPDQVVAMSEKPFDVPAKGTVRYQFFTVDPGFKEDKWIQQAECKPGNRSVVHHIIVGVIPPNGAVKFQGSLHSEWLTATAPGARPLILPEGYAKLVPAGSKLVFQMHYTPNGKPQTDRSFVALKFADPKTVKKQVGTDKAGNNSFVIPPNAKDFPVKATKTFDRDTLIMTMFPHMHLRGCSFRYTLHYPDGLSEILLDVPHYDFNWQNGYELTTPKRVPSGTKLVCEATFDNSAENLANPNPNATVRWGDQTWDEMMIGYFDAALADQDLTQLQQRTRSEAFAKQSPSVKLSDEIKQQCTTCLKSTEEFNAFGRTLRKTLPQLDRVCWSTITPDKLTLERVAQEPSLSEKIPYGNVGRQVDARLSKLASVANASKPQVLEDLSREKPFDLQYMAKAFQSSVHIPITIGDKKGTLNFWSTEKNAFSPEAVEVLKEVVERLKTSQ